MPVVLRSRSIGVLFGSKAIPWLKAPVGRWRPSGQAAPRAVEIALLFSGLLLVTGFLFGWHGPAESDLALPLLFLSFMLVGILALRGGLFVSPSAILVLALVALNLSQKRLSALFANAQDGMRLLDGSGRIIEANPAAASWLGRMAPTRCAMPLRSLEQGRLLAQSTVDVGSVFRVELVSAAYRAEISPVAEARPTATPLLRGVRRVLYVEGFEVNGLLMQAMLEKHPDVLSNIAARSSQGLACAQHNPRPTWC